MSGTRAHVAIDGILATLRAYSGLSADGGTGVWVYDGPVMAISGEIPQEYVCIGFDGDLGGDGMAVDIDQSWASLGAQRRDETGSVQCCVEARPKSTDDTDLPGLRSRAVDIFTLVELALRATPAVGKQPELLWTEVSTGQLYQSQDQYGAFVRLTFTVSYRARI